MALCYVTGTPGTTKSTIQKELQNRGYKALAIDQCRFGGPVNLKTGESTTVPPIEERGPDWFEQHEWRVSRAGMEELKAEAKDKDIYLCGVTTTEHLVWDLFDKVLYLNSNEDALRHRVATRKDTDYGQGKGEMEDSVNQYRVAQEKIATLDVTLIDATGSISETVETVIEASKASQS